MINTLWNSNFSRATCYNIHMLGQDDKLPPYYTLAQAQKNVSKMLDVMSYGMKNSTRIGLRD